MSSGRENSNPNQNQSESHEFEAQSSGYANPQDTNLQHEDHQLSQLLAKEIPIKQEGNDLSIDELDKMISETMNHDSNYLQHQKRNIEDVDGVHAEGNKRQHQDIDIQVDDNGDGVDELDIEFEKAIENHHRESSAPPSVSDKNEGDELRMIANEFQQATSSKPRESHGDYEEKDEHEQDEKDAQSKQDEKDEQNERNEQNQLNQLDEQNQQNQQNQLNVQNVQNEVPVHENNNSPDKELHQHPDVIHHEPHIEGQTLDATVTGQHGDNQLVQPEDEVLKDGDHMEVDPAEAELGQQNQSANQPEIQSESQPDTQQTTAQSDEQHTPAAEIGVQRSPAPQLVQQSSVTQPESQSIPTSTTQGASNDTIQAESHQVSQASNEAEVRPQDRNQTEAAPEPSSHVSKANSPLNSTSTSTSTSASASDSDKSKVVLHEGMNIPADSELLNTNTAFAAYNALSSQLPPLATLASAHLAALPLPIISPDFLPPRIQLLINTLPTLDNLASQLLRIVAMGPYQKILDLVAQPDTPQGATYRDLTSLFEFTKKLYSEEDPFLNVEHLAPGIWKMGDKTPPMFRNREQSIESTLRKVNLATFLGATLGTLEVGFFYLNEIFLDIFCPLNTLDPKNSLSNMNSNNMSLQNDHTTVIGDSVGKLLKPQAILYLDLKTQAYISAIEAGERSREEILEDILPSSMEEILLNRRNTKNLTPTELDFIERCKSRKITLLNYSEEKDLSEEYEWLSFLKELFEYSSKNMGFLIWGKRSRLSRPEGIINTTISSNVPTSSINASTSTSSANTPHSQEILNNAANSELRHQQELEAERQRVQEVMQNTDINDITNALLPSEIQEQQIHLRINPRSTVRNIQRRPWTREEEKALRQALELKGPMWSTILDLFGAGGKISEALKNRTQVQLKDKARNWKMFFLKSGLPVPKYLHKVTGDLDREDSRKINKNSKMNKKTAAAPVPPPVAKK